MFEFRDIDYYRVAESIRKAYDTNERYQKYDRNILFDENVSTTNIDVCSERFRVVNSDDDEEYYKRLDYLFNESFRRFVNNDIDVHTFR